MIKCIECGFEYSEEESVCPNCACPTIETIKENANTTEILTAESRKNIDVDKEEISNSDNSNNNVIKSYKSYPSSKYKVLVSYRMFIVGILVLLLMVLGGIVLLVLNNHKAESISLSENAVSLKIDDTAYLSATILPIDANNKHSIRDQNFVFT